MVELFSYGSEVACRQPQSVAPNHRPYTGRHGPGWGSNMALWTDVERVGTKHPTTKGYKRVHEAINGRAIRFKPACQPWRETGSLDMWFYIGDSRRSEP